MRRLAAKSLPPADVGGEGLPEQMLAVANIPATQKRQVRRVPVRQRRWQAVLALWAAESCIFSGVCFYVDCDYVVLDPRGHADVGRVEPLA